MSTSTTHDFYLGRGPNAQRIGSAHLDECACHGLGDIVRASTADEYTALVEQFLNAAEADQTATVTHVGGEWPWPWPTSHGTDYTYAFDAGAVWTALHGERWSMRAGHYVPPEPDETPVAFPPGLDYCGYTGIDAADTTARRYGPLLGDTHRHELHQLGLRILADITLPLGPGAPTELAELRAQLSPHLRFAVTAHESTVDLEFEVFGYRDGDAAAETAAHALAVLPALYGWTDLDGGPPRFGVRVAIAADDRHSSHPALSDRHTRAVLATY